MKLKLFNKFELKTNMTSIQIIPLFKYLPDVLKELIYEYDPNRRVLLNKICNEYRLFFPFWVRTTGDIGLRLFLNDDIKRYIFTKYTTMVELCLSSGCDNCYCIKTSRMILRYIEKNCFENYGGLYCDKCLELQNRK